MEGRLRLIITYNLYNPLPMQDVCESYADAVIYIVFSCPINKDTMTYHDSLDFAHFLIFHVHAPTKTDD